MAQLADTIYGYAKKQQKNQQTFEKLIVKETQHFQHNTTHIRQSSTTTA